MPVLEWSVSNVLAPYPRSPDIYVPDSAVQNCSCTIGSYQKVVPVPHTYMARGTFVLNLVP
eukprot:226267-Rhodomonas_salina.2